jgi:hypothetical protein
MNGLKMNPTDWQDFLKKESQQVISDYLKEKREGVPGLWEFIELPEEMIESEWMGEGGASEEQLQSAEERLDIDLPPSYRNFLKSTNGWNYSLFGDPFRVFGHPFRFYSSEEVRWFRSDNQEWIDIWMDSLQESLLISNEEYFTYGKDQNSGSLRIEYLQSAVQISEVFEGTVVLLNSEIIVEGEWEAWIFCNAVAGAYRYPSFSDMICNRALARV